MDTTKDGENKEETNRDETEESEEDEDESEQEVAEPLATTRSRRTNAGNLMSKMIQDEEDEFYANLYGGFHEEEDDVDFDDEEEADEDEVEGDYDVDSDFSIDETDEIAPEFQAVDEEPKKKARAYKDPKPKGYSAAQSAPSSSTPLHSRPRPSSSKTLQSPVRGRGERTFRDSTRKKTEETIKNIKTGPKKKKKLKNIEAYRPLSQEEMLAEAKITEEENLKSLEIYQRLESERLKKIKQVKKTLPPPYVTYLSTTMPILGTEERYTRNFMTFVT